MSSDNETSTPATAGENENRDKTRKLILSLLLVIVVVSMGRWMYQRTTHVYTDDARISADMIDISSKVAGWIVGFPVSTGDLLEPGDTIAVIDSRETQFKLAELEAQVSAMTADYEGQQAEMLMVEQQTTGALQAAQSHLDVAEASLSASNSELDFRASEWQRAQTLRAKKIISQQDYESAQVSFRKSRQGRQAALASVASARAKLVEAQAAQSRLKVMDRNLAKFQFERQSLQAQLERQRIDLNDRRIGAPQQGTIDKIFVDRGEYVQPGRRLLLMHNPNKVWVSANIKETEIRHLQIGQPVEVIVDAYPSEIFVGEIEKIGHAVTSQFSLLPSTNPSGNFTKVTQRLTVKIAIEQRNDLLKPGMMVEVAIDIR